MGGKILNLAGHFHSGLIDDIVNSFVICLFLLCNYPLKLKMNAIQSKIVG